MEPEEIALKRAQDCISSFPTIVLGSGASAPYGLASMSALGRHLLENIEPDAEDMSSWVNFRAALESGIDLERALQSAKFTLALTDKIVDTTWKLLGQQNCAVLLNVLNDSRFLPLSRLFHGLLLSTHHRLKVVTTNYDCLAEYAANSLGLDSYTGFTHGYLGRVDAVPPFQISKNNRCVKTVDIAKVHGSLDWFTNKNGNVLCTPNLNSLPDGWRPLIVTPGVSKYEKTHSEPFRTILTRADGALKNSNGYLTIGYGFNDEHIQPKLIEGILESRKKVVILARTFSPALETLLGNGKIKEYLAIQKKDDSSMLYAPEFSEGFKIEGIDLWNLSTFLDWATVY